MPLVFQLAYSQSLALPHSEYPLPTILMKSKRIPNWDKMVHDPFKKIMKFDLIFMRMGAVIGTGAGAYFAASGFLG